MRWVAWAAGIVIVLLAAAVAGAALWADELLTLALRRAGFPDGAVTLAAFHPHGARFGLELGDGAGAESVTVDYSPAGLLSGTIDAVAVHGARLTASLDGAGGVRVAGMPLGGNAGAGADAGGGGLPPLPAGRVTVADSVVAVETPAGRQEVPVALTLERTADGMVGEIALPGVALDLGWVGALAGAPLAGRATIDGTLSLALDGGTVRVGSDACVSLALADLVVGGQAVRVPEALCMEPVDTAPLVEVVPGRWETLAAAVSLTLPAVAMPGIADARDVAAEVVVDEGTVSADLSAAVVRGPADAVAPLALAGEAAWTPGSPATVALTATGPGGVPVVRVSAHHDPAAGKGRAEVRVEPVAFSATGPDMGRLVPALPAGLSVTAGRISARGHATWSGAGIDGAGAVLLDGVAAALGPAAVVGVNGVVRLSGLTPPVVPTGQVLAVKLLDVGLPLTDGTVAFGYGADGRLAVERAEWRWAGGSLRTRPFRLDPTDPSGRVVLEAERIDLGRLLDLAAVEGLSATGGLSGTLPVRIDGGTVRIDGGTLAAVAPGRLSYDPELPPSFLQGDPGSPTEILRGALTDFRYQDLRMTVDGTAGGELAVRLTVEGFNPDFYDGHPVRLNLNLSGALDRILRQSLDAYRIPDAVRDRMTEFGRQSP